MPAQARPAPGKPPVAPPRGWSSAGVPEPAASAEVLLSELLGMGRAELAVYEEPLTDEQASLYEAWISRRLEREPVQRILGYAYFRNLVLDLNEETLIPRPDTESVVDLALERIDLARLPLRGARRGHGLGGHRDLHRPGTSPLRGPRHRGLRDRARSRQGQRRP